MKPLIIYHHNCADGFTAAWVAWNHFKGECDLHPGVFGEPAPDCTGRDVYILDFSYHMPVMEQIIKVAKTVTVLDHHESAMLAWMKWFDEKESGTSMAVSKRGTTTFESLSHRLNGVYALFDMAKSGAMMAWDYFHSDDPHHAGAPAPKLVEYVQDRDLWQFKLPHSKEISFWYFSFPYTMQDWDEIAMIMQSEEGFRSVVGSGTAIMRKHFKDIYEFIGVAKQTMTIGGHEVPVLNCPYHWGSDAAHAMAEGKPFAAYYYDKEGAVFFGLRSTDDGINVADIAKQYGGGGHPHSAGFVLKAARINKLELPK